MEDIKLTKEAKITLIKRAISTVQGWENLARSLQGKGPKAKEECIVLLREIGGEKEIDLPVVETDGSTSQNIAVSFAELLVQQLEQHIAKISEEA